MKANLQRTRQLRADALIGQTHGIIRKVRVALGGSGVSMP
jgi:hypothetical protein